MMGQKNMDPRLQELTRPRQFWDTQPVPKLADFQQQDIIEGEIDPEKDVEKVRKDPYALLEQFEWAEIDLNDPKHLEDVYAFLTENYVEDDDNMFRFDYSKDFLRWSLNPPGFYPEWIIGVRVQKSKKWSDSLLVSQCKLLLTSKR